MNKDYQDYWFNYVFINNPNEIKEKIKQEYFEYKSVKIHLDKLEHQDGKIAKLNIIFIHGTSMYSRFYIDFCYLLWKKGFNIYLPDMIGHGKSQGKRGNFTMKKFIDIISTLIDLIRKENSRKICVMGSSLGGIASLYSAASDPRIDTIICHNAAIFNEGAYKHIIKVKSILRLFIPLVPYIAKILPHLKLSVFKYLPAESLVNSPEGLKIYEKIIQDPVLEDRYTMKSLSAQMRESMQKPIEEIKIPVTFINGEEDGLFSVEYMNSLFQRLPNAKNQFVIIKNAAHLIFQENTLEILEKITDFLNNSLLE